MPIQIIDGFQVNTASPIDTRIVASGSAARNAIQNKYHGLRVFDISNNIPYVWNGTTWISENSTGINGSGTINYIPRFTSSNILGNSIFYQDGDSLKTEDTGGGNALVQIDSYNGSVTALSFIGNGSNLSNINGLNINPGSIPLSRLTNGSTGWLLSGASPNPIYVNPTQITVGTASVATQSTTINTISNSTNYISFVSNTSGNQTLRVNNDFQYNPSSGQLTVPIINATRVISPNLPAIGHIGGLSNTRGSVINHMFVSATTSSSNRIEINTFRHSTPTGSPDWLTTAHRIQARVDDQYMGYIQFNGPSLETGIAFGTGYQGLTASGLFSGGANPYEHMRIDISGRIMMNTTSALNSGSILQLRSDSVLFDGLVHMSFNESHNIFEFLNNSGTQRGRIVGNGPSGVLYNTTSDRRLKTDIEEMPSMYDKIKTLKPSKFKWISDNKEEFGFIAQEVYNVFPNMRGELSYCDVNSPDFDIENPLNKDGNEYYYGLDYGRFTPYLTKALQETIQKLEDLTDKIKNANSLEDLKSSL